MRLFLLLFALIVTTKVATANPFLEYFLTMSYVESGMEPCSSVVERLGDTTKRQQFLRIIGPALAAIQSGGNNPIDTQQIMNVLDRAVSYCGACPSATFGMALAHAVRNHGIAGLCSAPKIPGAETEEKEPVSTLRQSTSSLPLNNIKQKTPTQSSHYIGGNKSRGTRSKESSPIRIID